MKVLAPKLNCAFQIATAFSLLCSAGLAHASDVVGFELNPHYNIRKEANAKSDLVGNLSKKDGEIVQVVSLGENSDWAKIVRPDGTTGFVSRKALRKVELNGNYVIRSQPSLTASREGTIHSARKSADPLVLTGSHKMVKEQGKNVEWLEIIKDGKKVWVAGGVLHKSEKKTVESSDVPKVTAAKTPAKTPAAEKAVPLPPPRPKSIKPVASTEPTAKKPSKEVPTPPTRPVAIAKKAEPKGRLCVSKPSEFTKSERMKSAFPKDYTPFTAWSAQLGPDTYTFQPHGESGQWDLVNSRGEIQTSTLMQLCIDENNQNPTISAFGTLIELKNPDSIQVNYGLLSPTFTRSKSAKIVK